MEERFDVIVIGGGPAGLAAAMYTSRAGLRTLVLEKKKLGGRALEAWKIENYPGYPEPVSGPDLMEAFADQARRTGAILREDEAVVSLIVGGHEKTVMTRSGFHSALALIYATGAERKRLMIPGESELRGRGVSVCALCDGPLFKGKQVAVIGGEEAVEDVNYLTNVVGRLYFIPVGRIQTQLPTHERLQTLDVKVRQINGRSVVNSISVTDRSGIETEISVDGVFVALGSSLEMAKGAGVATDAHGFVKTNRNMQTSIEGVFAAGECTGIGMQISTSVGQGALAGISATKHVNRSIEKRRKSEHQ